MRLITHLPPDREADVPAGDDRLTYGTAVATPRRPRPIQSHDSSVTTAPNSPTASSTKPALGSAGPPPPATAILRGANAGAMRNRGRSDGTTTRCPPGSVRNFFGSTWKRGGALATPNAATATRVLDEPPPAASTTAPATASARNAASAPTNSAGTRGRSGASGTTPRSRAHASAKDRGSNTA